MAKLTAYQVLGLLADAGVPQNSNDLGKWLAVAKAESSLNPAVVNHLRCTGLFQIHPVHRQANPTWTVEWLKNPKNNVAAAKSVSKNWRDLGPWKSSRIGRYANLPSSQAQAKTWLSSGAVRDNPTAGSLTDAATDAATSVAGPAKAAAEVAAKLTDPGVWLRFAYGAAGVALVVVGIATLAGKSPAGRMARRTVKRGVRVAGKVGT